MVKSQSEFVSLAGTIGGILMVTLLLIMIFAKEYAVIAFSNVVWGFVVLGIVFGAFQYKLLVSRKEKDIKRK